MAKPKRSADDLDAELAALEAELAALGQKKPKREAKPAPPPGAPVPAAPPSAEEAPTSSQAPAPPARSRFGIKLPKRGKATEPAPTAAAAPAPATPLPAPQPARAAPKPTAPPTYDASLWRQEDGAWVRSVPREAVVVRRVLDENGRVVREEPASARDLEDETPMKAERGIGKLFRRLGK